MVAAGHFQITGALMGQERCERARAIDRNDLVAGGVEKECWDCRRGRVASS